MRTKCIVEDACGLLDGGDIAAVVGVVLEQLKSVAWI